MLKVIISIAFVIFSADVFAGKMMFGEQDSFRKFQDVEFKDPNGKELYLAHRITTKFFIAGVYIKEQGYVLPLKNSEEDIYYPLTAAQIIEMQADGSLPKQLPKYEFTLWEYAFGYSLWLLIGIMAIYYVIKRIFKKNKPEVKEQIA